MLRQAQERPGESKNSSGSQVLQTRPGDGGQPDPPPCLAAAHSPAGDNRERRRVQGEVRRQQHPGQRRFELVALALEALEHPVERPTAAIVDDGLPIPIEALWLGYIQPDRKDDALRLEVEPIAGRRFLRAALPPPERLVILVRLLVL